MACFSSKKEKKDSLIILVEKEEKNSRSIWLKQHLVNNETNTADWITSPVYNAFSLIHFLHGAQQPQLIYCRLNQMFFGKSFFWKKYATFLFCCLRLTTEFRPLQIYPLTFYAKLLTVYITYQLLGCFITRGQSPFRQGSTATSFAPTYSYQFGSFPVEIQFTDDMIENPASRADRLPRKTFIQENTWDH